MCLVIFVGEVKMEETTTKIVKEWTTKAGYKSFIRETKLLCPEVKLKWMCGYVGVPKTHLLYNKDYNKKIIEDFNVFGGVTFSGFFDDRDIELYWIGFDCMHGLPGSDMNPYSIKFVTKECEDLAKQIKELESNNKFIKFMRKIENTIIDFFKGKTITFHIKK